MPGQGKGDADWKICRSQLAGPYPSHVRELLASRYPIAMYEEGLARGESSWGHGGYVVVPELAAGVAQRASRRPEIVEGSSWSGF